MRRLTTLLAVGALSLLVTGTPAEAKSRRTRAVCDDDGCEASASNEHDGRGGGRRRQGGARPVTCRYHRLDLPPGVVLTRPDGTPIPAEGAGRWFERVCVDSREHDAIQAGFPDLNDPVSQSLALQEIVRAADRTPVFVPTATPALVEEARSRLTFPDGQPRFAPASPWTFVNHPTTLWLEGSLTPTSATAEVPGLRVTVTATPERAEWTTGDGDVVPCPAPGRPPDPSVPGDTGECSHRWTWPSADRPDAAYPVWATVFWHVAWTAEGAPAGGDLGTVPRRTSTLMVPVAEIQSVNAPPGKE